ncbi:hypothetical protein GY45DRAFT_1322051 [Cubamyces sp. BRFM 1775]|nr:hypothetical protein GY45DRAFT_1322051 [Cubamyces sp. BRFM 1775]
MNRLSLSPGLLRSLKTTVCHCPSSSEAKTYNIPPLSRRGVSLGCHCSSVLVILTTTGPWKYGVAFWSYLSQISGYDETLGVLYTAQHLG